MKRGKYMKRKMFFLGLIIAGILSSLAFAEAQKPSTTAAIPGMPGNDSEQMKKMQEQMRQQQGQMLEQLKQQNPQMYEQMKAQQDLQNKISAITADFQAKKISYEAAKSALRPLLEQQLKARATGVDTEIAQLQKRIDELQELKSNPGKAADKQADVLLGKSQSGMPGMPGVF